MKFNKTLTLSFIFTGNIVVWYLKRIYLKISSIMENLANKILKLLKEHVRQNIKEIQYNQDEINRMLSEPALPIKQKELDYKYSLNQDLLNENEDFIKLQLEITEFLEKYSHLFSAADDYEYEDTNESEDDKMNSFNQTVSGVLKFDPKHPQFNNSKFFNDLLNYYQEKEDYEKCQELLKLREFKN